MTPFTIAPNGSIRENPQTPQQQREFLIYYARVLLREAGARRARDPRFSRTLAGWAANARAEVASIDVRPAQGKMFG